MAARGRKVSGCSINNKHHAEEQANQSVAGAKEAVAKGVSRWEAEEVSKARG